MAFIEFKNVSKIYKMGEVEIKALDDISFEIEKGEFVVVLGNSGAGKTTILNLLGGMDTISAGSIVDKLLLVLHPSNVFFESDKLLLRG